MKRILIAVNIMLLIFSIRAFAWENRPQLRWQQVYRWDDRRGHDQLYINRFSALFNCFGEKDKPLFKLTPFVELRRNINESLWVRKEAGVEIGKDIFPWLYLGDAIQQAWLNEDFRDYRDFEKRETTESLSRILLSHPLIKTRFLNLIGFILDEYTVDLDYGKGTRNEVAIGFTVPVGKYIETGIDWRHIDRIHHYDSDTLEVQLTAIF